MIAVLDAFLAVYELRPTGGSVHEPHYIGNLPPDCWPAKARERIERGGVPSPEVVRRTVVETRERLNDPTWTQVPVFIGRNLLLLLEDEKLPGVESIHRALLPYWPVLWRLAARGYYVATGEAIYERALREPKYEAPIRPLGDGVLQLAFMRLGGGDLSVLISFLGAFGPMYPVSTYPKLAEFRAMLAALRPDGQRQWTGANFFGYVTGTAESPIPVCGSAAPTTGSPSASSLAHWTGLRALSARPGNCLNCSARGNG